jgi:hypothetical protein
MLNGTEWEWECAGLWLAHLGEEGAERAWRNRIIVGKGHGRPILSCIGCNICHDHVKSVRLRCLQCTNYLKLKQSKA